MRIIAGEYASRIIQTQKGTNTRPTLDKVREAVFMSLGGLFEGGSFLDIYAGSGANGLEAISRGFDEATFVDKDKKAIQVIKDNIESLGCKEKTIVLSCRDKIALDKFKEEKKTFDVIYLDPPYANDVYDDILKTIDEYELLSPGGTIVVESDKEQALPESVGKLNQVKNKIYGTVKVTYYKGE